MRNQSIADDRIFKKANTKMLGTPLPQNDLVKVMNVRQGIKQSDFKKIAIRSPFTSHEWSYFLNLSERTMQRYEKHKKAFAPSQSEKILEIEQLNDKGMEVFEDKN